MTTSNRNINVVHIKNPNNGKETKFFLEPWVKKRFDNKVIPDLKKRDKDCIIAIDGKEGSGKSTLAQQWCKYIDPTFDLDKVVFTPDGFRDAIYKAKKGQAVLFDEAFTGFSSRSALSGVNRTLVSLMMQIRQKNLFIVIVMPTFFLLDKYISLFRTRVLVHVYENKGRRGFFRVYSSKKKRLLILNKEAKTYSYGVHTNKKGRFYGVFPLGDKEDEEKYRTKKLKALEANEKNPMTATQVKHMIQRNTLLYLLKKKFKYSYEQLSDELNQYDINLTPGSLNNIISKFESEDKNEKK